ncbi:hypothetical protein [Thiobacillus denitrificans]|uniref:hypothetical protein n=1 Tax=Thiobacillus denitrificans TaxID=36861 RepID=UPI000363BC6E|nr:hypothetical protein [Thiobacillus denitrificans]
MSNSHIGLEDPAWVEQYKARWPCLPKEMAVIEFLGTGDPFFGGTADDRPLGKNGRILEPGERRDEVASFTTIEEAHQAALCIKNRRAGSVLGVAPRWR